MGEVIAVVSGKGGVGKTIFCTNVGANLALLGKSVVLIDTDLGLRNLDVALGMENLIVYNLVDVLDEKCDFQQALIRDERYGELYLMPSAQTKNQADISPYKLAQLADDLKDIYDYVIIDSPPGIETGFNTAANAASRAVIVTTPNVAAVRSADKVAGMLGRLDNIKNIDIVVNRVYPELMKLGSSMTIEDINDILGLNILGIIPENIEIIKSYNTGKPITSDRISTGRTFIDISKRIAGANIPLESHEAKSGIFKGLFTKKN